MDNYFSNNLKYLRKQKGIALQPLADQLGISKSLLNQYELGNSEPTLGNLIKIVHYFGCSLDVIAEKDITKGILTTVQEPEEKYGNSEVNRLRIENNALREALREIGKGIKH